MLTKSVKIANKTSDENDEEGWFCILEFLNSYYQQINEKYEKLSTSDTLNKN